MCQLRPGLTWDSPACRGGGCPWCRGCGPPRPVCSRSTRTWDSPRARTCPGPAIKIRIRPCPGPYISHLISHHARPCPGPRISHRVIMSRAWQSVRAQKLALPHDSGQWVWAGLLGFGFNDPCKEDIAERPSNMRRFDVITQIDRFNFVARKRRLYRY